jgi:hypothetical protein
LLQVEVAVVLLKQAVLAVLAVFVLQLQQQAVMAH